jgi:hypothetical protein
VQRRLDQTPHHYALAKSTLPQQEPSVAPPLQAWSTKTSLAPSHPSAPRPILNFPSTFLPHPHKRLVAPKRMIEVFSPLQTNRIDYVLNNMPLKQLLFCRKKIISNLPSKQLYHRWGLKPPYFSPKVFLSPGSRTLSSVLCLKFLLHVICTPNSELTMRSTLPKQ